MEEKRFKSLQNIVNENRTTTLHLKLKFKKKVRGIKADLPRIPGQSNCIYKTIISQGFIFSKKTPQNDPKLKKTLKDHKKFSTYPAYIIFDIMQDIAHLTCES